MRNVLLLVFSALVLLNGTTASAQIVTQNGNKDSASAVWDGASSEVSVYNKVKITASTPVALKWNVTDYRFPTGWDTVNAGFCDNIQCYTAAGTSTNLFKDGDVKTTDVVDNATFSDFHMLFKPHNPPTGSSAWVRVAVRESSIGGASRNLTFIAYKSALGVNSSYSSSDDIVLYPNPARDAVNVIYDANAGVKTIAVYNIIGKLMGPIYKPADNGSAKINLEEMPNGIYFLRLMDGQGHVLATRRFTRQ